MPDLDFELLVHISAIAVIIGILIYWYIKYKCPGCGSWNTISKVQTFTLSSEASDAPFQKEHRIVFIGCKSCGICARKTDDEPWVYSSRPVEEFEDFAR